MPRKNRAKVSLQGACTAVAGKGWRSELLCRVLFWWRHATVSHRGKIWIAHHREDWMVELQCTSMRTLERAITQLKHNDPPLIETCQRLFGGLVIQHIRPTDVCVAAVENVYGRKLEQPAAMTDASPENGGPGTPKLADPEPVKNGGPGTPKMADPTKGITIMDYSMEYTKACTPPPVSACNPDQAESSLTGKGNTTVNGVLPPEVCPPLSPPQNPAEHAHNVGDLVKLWRSTLSEVYPDMHVSLTAQERGQLRQFLMKCPKGKVGLILDCALRDWHGFTQRCSLDKTAFKTPLKPTVGFLLKYASTAVDFWKPAPATKVKAKLKVVKSHPSPKAAPRITDLTPAQRKLYASWIKAELPCKVSEVVGPDAVIAPAAVSKNATQRLKALRDLVPTFLAELAAQKAA